MSARPAVSVIIPCYNAAQTVSETLASVQGQTHPNWEAICVDDDSSDDTLARIEAIAECDARIRCISVPHGGLAATRNRGLPLARALQILFLDADDVLRPDAVEVLLRASAANGGAAIVAGGLELLDQSGRPLGIYRFPTLSSFTVDELLRASHFSVTTLVPAAALGERPFDKELPACEDWGPLAAPGQRGDALRDRAARSVRLPIAQWKPQSQSRPAARERRTRAEPLVAPRQRRGRPARRAPPLGPAHVGAVALANGNPSSIEDYFHNLPAFEPAEGCLLAVAYSIGGAYTFARGALGHTWQSHGAQWSDEISAWLDAGPLRDHADTIRACLAQIAFDPHNRVDSARYFLSRTPAGARIVIYGLGNNGQVLLEQLRTDAAVRGHALCAADDHAPKHVFDLLGLPRVDPRAWRSWPADTVAIITPNNFETMRQALQEAGGHEGTNFMALASTCTVTEEAVLS